jgi:hypothetical protein
VDPEVTENCFFCFDPSQFAERTRPVEFPPDDEGDLILTEFRACAECHRSLEQGDVPTLARRHAAAVRRAHLTKNVPEWAIDVEALDLTARVIEAWLGSRET